MGLSTLTMSRIYKGQLKGRLGEDEQLEWETWPAVGLSKVLNSLNYQQFYQLFIIFLDL